LNRTTDRQQADSIEHPAVARIFRLRDRSARDASGLFFAEGVRFVHRAARTGADIRTVVVSPDTLVSPTGRALVRDFGRSGTPCVRVTPEVFRSLSILDCPQGLGAVVRQRWTRLARARPADGLCWVALHKVQNPGNLGMILRTCEAVGAAGLLLVGPDVDPFDPVTVRATMGSIFSLRLVRTNHFKFHQWAGRHRCLVVGTSPHGGADYDRVRYRPPTVLFMGSERKGLTEDEEDLCDTMVRIPMVGRVDSLNLAVATSVMLYEVFRRRKRGPRRGRRRV
jgi:TrmH family RNA methyltransferase